MYGPIFSVLLLSLVPVWGLTDGAHPASSDIGVAPPVTQLSRELPIGRLDAISASGVIIMDLASGQSIYQRSASLSRPMASLTKLMTALLIVEEHALDETVTIPQDIALTIGNVAHLPPGERFTVADLLSALLIESANDAAVTLARFHSGSVEAFVQEMNERARMLGLTATVFSNPTGLDAALQRSSPRDLAWLAAFVWRHPEIRERMGRGSEEIQSESGKTIPLTHTHVLLHSDPFIIAGKTGTTDGAGQCLLSIVQVNGRTFVIVLLHSNDRYRDMRTVLTVLSS